MVKVTFGASLAQKEPKEVCGDGSLIPAATDVEGGPRVYRWQSRLWCWCMYLGLSLMLWGVVVGGAYLYRSYILQESEVYFCGVDYLEEDYMVEDYMVEEARAEEQSAATPLRHIRESVRLLEREGVELIDVPLPEFSGGDRANIVHDFNKGLTAYLDLTLDKCYVIPLNTSVVMPPRDFRELLINIKAGTYLPQSYLVHEQMVVTEKLDHLKELGSHISSLCRGLDTYKLERRAAAPGVQKREAPNCRKIRHFESAFVVETLICEP